MTAVPSPQVLRALIADTIAHAARDLSPEQTVAVVVDCLGRVRADLLRHVGYHAMRQLDDWLLASLRRRRLRRAWIGLPNTEGPLDAGSADAACGRAALLLWNALECATVQARSVGMPALILVAVEALVDALADRLGGPPEPAAVLDALERRTAAGVESTPAVSRSLWLQ